MVLIEVVGGLVPVAAVAHGVTLSLVVAVGVLHKLVAVVIEHHILRERVELAQALVVHVLVAVHAVAVDSGIVVACGDSTPCLTHLLEVADIAVTQREVVAKPCERAVV